MKDAQDSTPLSRILGATCVAMMMLVLAGAGLGLIYLSEHELVMVKTDEAVAKNLSPSGLGLILHPFGESWVRMSAVFIFLLFWDLAWHPWLNLRDLWTGDRGWNKTHPNLRAAFVLLYGLVLHAIITGMTRL